MNVRLYMAYFCGLCGIVTGALLAHNPVLLSVACIAIVVVIVAVACITHSPTMKRK